MIGLYFLLGCSTKKNIEQEGVIVESWEVLPIEEYRIERNGETDFVLFYNDEMVLKFITGSKSRVYKKFQRSYVSLYCRNYQYYSESKECELEQFSKTKHKYIKETGKKRYIGRAENRTSQFHFIGTKLYVVDGLNSQKTVMSMSNHINYLREYEKLNTVSDFNDFSSKYIVQNFDPDNLITLEKQKELLQKDAIKQEELRKKEAIKYKRQLEQLTVAKSNTEIFRKNIEIGNRSNCGLVVNVKSNIAEVQTPEGVMWLAISEIYPPHLSQCKIVNGVYVHNPLRLSSFY